MPRPGHGRPHKHIYDGIILHRLAKDWIHSMVARMTDRRFPEMPSISDPDDLAHFPYYSYSDFWRIIRDSDYMVSLSLRHPNYPKVTRKTVTRHVNEMEKRGDLEKYHRKGAHNKTLFRLSTRKLMHYLMFLLHGMDGLLKYLIRIGKMRLV